MAISTLKTLIAKRELQVGDGICGYSLPDSRRSERLFGDVGRTKAERLGPKMESIDRDYKPRDDTCIRAFVRLMAEAASNFA